MINSQKRKGKYSETDILQVVSVMLTVANVAVKEGHRKLGYGKVNKERTLSISKR